MKKQLSILIATLGMAYTASAQMVIPQQPLSIVDIQYSSSGVPFYQNLLNRCTTYVSDLMMAVNIANMQKESAGVGVAANTLKNAILSKAAMLPPPFTADVYTNTVEAIRVAGMMVNQIELGVAQKQAVLGKNLTDRVRYRAYKRAIQLISQTYDTLDRSYFVPSIQICIGGCNPFADLNSHYSDGLRELALNYLDYSQATGPGTADTDIELLVAYTSVNAAKVILSQSQFRRDVACTVSGLHNLQYLIGEMITGSLQTMPDQTKEQNVRAGIESARQQIQSSLYGCGSGYGYHHPKY